MGAALPPEPPKGPAVTTVQCMGDGRQISRRFAKQDTLGLVRRWVEASSPADKPMRAFYLISRIPRFVSSLANANVTLEVDQRRSFRRVDGGSSPSASNVVCQ